MLRRDLLTLFGIVIWGSIGFIVWGDKNKSSEILIKEFTIWLFGLVLYIVILLILEIIFPSWLRKKINLRQNKYD